MAFTLRLQVKPSPRKTNSFRVAASLAAAIAWLLPLLGLSLSVQIAFAQSSSEPREKLSDTELLSQLRRGGLTLYFHHTATDFEQSDESMRDDEDCAKQRNLTDQGRAEARQIGSAIRRLSIPVGKVLASPFCRTRETARLAFGKAEPSREVFAAGLAKLFLMPPMPRVNRIIVSHGNPFFTVVGPPHLAEGEAAVIRSKDPGYTVIGRIRADEWERLETATTK